MLRFLALRANPLRSARALGWLTLGLALAAGVAAAQAPNSTPGQSPDQSNDDASKPGDPATVFPHSDTARYWISGQVNVILQWHPSFQAQYSGTNSLTSWAQSATTHVMTLYTGYQLTPTTEVFADMEDATGSGIGNANGLAGYTNLDSVRLADGVALSKAPYLARFMLRQIIPLRSGPRLSASRNLPARAPHRVSSGQVRSG
jgi:hypothetical protein